MYQNEQLEGWWCVLECLSCYTRLYDVIVNNMKFRNVIYHIDAASALDV